jgi:hypothetical protein
MTLVDCNPQVNASIALIHSQSLVELSSIISDGTAIELEEARARAKSQQLGVKGLSVFSGFVAREKKFVEKLRTKHRDETVRKRAMSERILYEGKAAEFEGPPLVIPIKLPDAEEERRKRLLVVAQRSSSHKESKAKTLESAMRHYEEKTQNPAAVGKESKKRFGFGSSKRKEPVPEGDRKRDKIKGAFGGLMKRSPKKDAAGADPADSSERRSGSPAASPAVANSSPAAANSPLTLIVDSPADSPVVGTPDQQPVDSPQILAELEAATAPSTSGQKHSLLKMALGGGKKSPDAAAAAADSPENDNDSPDTANAKAVRKRDKFMSLGKKISPSKLKVSTSFLPKGKLPSIGLRAGLKAGLNKVGNLVKKKDDSAAFSYKETAMKARVLWGSGENRRGEIAQNFVRGCIVFACVNVLERERRQHVKSFSERQTWSSKKPALGLEAEFNEEADLPQNSVPHDLDDIFAAGSLHRSSTMSLDDLYSAAGPPSPIHSRLRAMETSQNFHSPGSVRSGEDGENFWSVVERVFFVQKPKDEVVVEEVVEEVVVPRKKKAVEERVKWEWRDKVTWVDDAIKISTSNYGGGEGPGVGVPAAELKVGGEVKHVQTKDFKKRGEAWSRKRLSLARTFAALVGDGDATLGRVQERLFRVRGEEKKKGKKKAVP